MLPKNTFVFFPQLDPKCEPNCALNNYKDIEKKSRIFFGIECMEELKNAPATSKKIVKTRVDPLGVAQEFELCTVAQIASFVRIPLRTLDDGSKSV